MRSRSRLVAIGLWKAMRFRARGTSVSSARSARPNQAHAVWMRPGPRRALGDLEAASSPSRMLETGTLTSFEIDFACGRGGAWS